MSKTIDSIVQASLDSKNFRGVLLARFEFESPTGTQRFTNCQQTVYWDDGSGEVPYYGVGNLAAVAPAQETNELGNVTMNFTLSGIPNNLITGIFDKSSYQNKPCYLWYATLDSNYAVEYDTNEDEGPILIFAGLMDVANYTFGKEATITLSASSRLADWDRPRGGRFNESYQQTYVDPTDSGFKYVKPLQKIEVRFGGSSAADPGGGDLGLPGFPDDGLPPGWDWWNWGG